MLSLGPAVDTLHGQGIHQFDTCHRDTCVCSRNDRLNGSVDGRKRADSRHDRFRNPEETKRDFGRDSECAFRADEQTRQVIAGCRLATAGPGLDHAPVRQDHLQIQHKFAHCAVADRVGA